MSSAHLDETLVVKSPAKLNLFLEVTRRRRDGYHDIETVMHEVSLADELELTRSGDDSGPDVSEGFEIEGYPAPDDETNLVVRAHRLLEETAGRKLATRIRLVKTIPAGSGLGGGSSDAAAALVGLNELWGLGLDRRRLAELSARLGADVPYFVWGGTSVVCGIGEKVVPVEGAGRFWFVVVWPGWGLSTRRVYGELSPEEIAGPRHGAEGMLEAIRSGDPEAVEACVFNRLEAPAMRADERLAEFFRRLGPALGGARPHLTGSGSAAFAIMKDELTSRRLREELVVRGFRHAFVTATGTRPSTALRAVSLSNGTETQERRKERTSWKSPR